MVNSCKCKWSLSKLSSAHNSVAHTNFESAGVGVIALANDLGEQELQLSPSYTTMDMVGRFKMITCARDIGEPLCFHKYGLSKWSLLGLS
jgi:hypothetical protein